MSSSRETWKLSDNLTGVFCFNSRSRNLLWERKGGKWFDEVLTPNFFNVRCCLQRNFKIEIVFVGRTLLVRFFSLIQGDPKLAPHLGRRSWMTWSLSDQTGLKYNLFTEFGVLKCIFYWTLAILVKNVENEIWRYGAVWTVITVLPHNG